MEINLSHDFLLLKTSPVSASDATAIFAVGAGAKVLSAIQNLQRENILAIEDADFGKQLIRGLVEIAAMPWPDEKTAKGCMLKSFEFLELWAQNNGITFKKE